MQLFLIIRFSYPKDYDVPNKTLLAGSYDKWYCSSVTCVIETELFFVYKVKRGSEN